MPQRRKIKQKKKHPSARDEFARASYGFSTPYRPKNAVWFQATHEDSSGETHVIGGKNPLPDPRFKAKKKRR